MVLRLALAGPMAVGKSAVGRRIALRRGLPFVDLDDDLGDIPARFAAEGEAAFREAEAAALRARAAGAGVLALGGGALERPGSLGLLAGWSVVVLMAREETLAARLEGAAGAGRPLAGEWRARYAARQAGWRAAGPWVWVDGLGVEEVAAAAERAAGWSC